MRFLEFAPFVPAAKIEGDGDAGRAQFIGKSTVDHGPRHDHPSDRQGRDALRGGAASPATLDQAPLQDAHHCFEHGLEGALGTYTAPRNVGRQCHHWAGILDVLEMLAG
ncbi:MAG TPA: hypothetical protein VI320_38095 [Terracidiphilus sp.]